MIPGGINAATVQRRGRRKINPKLENQKMGDPQPRIRKLQSMSSCSVPTKTKHVNLFQ